MMRPYKRIRLSAERIATRPELDSRHETGKAQGCGPDSICWPLRQEILDRKCEIEFGCALRAEVIDTFIGERLCCILAHTAFLFRVPTDKTLSRVLCKSLESVKVSGHV
jgi:hypothetical protein